MSESVIAPFSVRLRGPHEQIDQDFPGTARVGLLHLLHDWIKQKYLKDWRSVAQELQRIHRMRPVAYDQGYTPGKEGDPGFDAPELLMQAPWQKVFDFC